MENSSNTTSASTRSKEDQTHNIAGHNLLCNTPGCPDFHRSHPPHSLPRQPSTLTVLRHLCSYPKHCQSQHGLRSERRSCHCGKLHKSKQEKQRGLQLRDVRALLLQHTHSDRAHRAIHCTKGNVNVHELPSSQQSGTDPANSEPGVAAAARNWSSVVEPERNISRSLEPRDVNEILLLVAHTMQYLVEYSSYRDHASKKMHYKTLAICSILTK